MESAVLAAAVMEMRAAGLPHREIAHKLGVDYQRLIRLGPCRPKRKTADWIAATEDIKALIVEHGYKGTAALLGVSPGRFYHVTLMLGIKGRTRMQLLACGRAVMAENHAWRSARRAEWLAACMHEAGIKAFIAPQVLHVLQRLRDHPAIPTWFDVTHYQVFAAIEAGSALWTLDKNSYVLTMPPADSNVEPLDVTLFAGHLRALWTIAPSTNISTG